MNLSKTEALKETAGFIAVAVNAVRSAGGDDALQKSVIKEKLFDQEIVNPSDRQVVMKHVNHELGTTYSINLIKQAKRLEHPLGADDTAKDPVKPLEVIGELKGSVELPVVAKPESAPAAQAAPVSTPAKEPKAAKATKPAAASTVTEDNTMNAKNNVESLVSIGYAKKKARVELLKEFFITHPKHDNSDAHPVADDGINALPMDAMADLLIFVQEKAKAAEAAAEVEFQKTAAGEGGIESKWIGLGAAVIGGGLSLLSKGEVTTGGLLGLAAGATGAYFLSDKFDGSFEGDFARYLVSGSIGLVLGGAGSHLGAMALDSILPTKLLGGQVDGEPLPVITIQKPAVSLNVPTSMPAIAGV